MKRPADERAKLLDRLHAESAPEPLIGDRRVVKAIAEDDAAARQCRLDELLDTPCARGEEKKQLGHIANRQSGVAPEHKRADLLAERRASGLARLENREPPLAEIGLQLEEKRGFPWIPRRLRR